MKKLKLKISASPVIESLVTYTIMTLLFVFVVFAVQNFVISNQLEGHISVANRKAITSESWYDAYHEIQSHLTEEYGEDTFAYAQIVSSDNFTDILASSGPPPTYDSETMEDNWEIGNQLIVHAQRQGRVREIISGATTFRLPYRDEPINLVPEFIIESSRLVIENETRGGE